MVGAAGSAAAQTAALAPTAYAQAALAGQGVPAPDFKVEVVGLIQTEFTGRVSAYVELRRRLEDGLTPLQETDDAGALTATEMALASRIRAARAGAKEGEIFSPAIAAEFRRVLRFEIDDNTLAALMDDNPGDDDRRINGRYPRAKPYSTVTANILARLPRLPADIQYRFMGRYLVLVDTKANMILDRLPHAIR